MGTNNMPAKNTPILIKILQVIFTVLNVIVTVGIIIAFVLMFVSFVSKSGYSVFGFRGYIVLSGSMSPTFGEGSYILVQNKAPGEIEAGDIITFRTATDSILTHRVDEALEGGASFITKGDANNVRDIAPVPAENVLGVAVYWLEGAGGLLLALNRPRNVIFCVLLLILWFILPEVVFRKYE